MRIIKFDHLDLHKFVSKSQIHAEEDAKIHGWELIDKYIDCKTRIKYKCGSCNRIVIKSPSQMRRAAKCRKCTDKLRMSPKGETGFRRCFNQYKIGARNRKLDFLLTKDEFIKIIFNNCFWCGGNLLECGTTTIIRSVLISEIASNNSIFGPHMGIDRVDNSKGYEVNN